MTWEVEYTDEFFAWWKTLNESEQDSVSRLVELLIEHGPDPRRVAILLIGGDKTGHNDWYDKFVPIADRIYGAHLKELEEDEKHGKKIL